MTDYVCHIPKRFQKPLAGLVKRLSSVVPEQDMVLGGGMVLEAMWGRRKTNDIDLFVPEDVIGRLMDERGDAFYPAVFEMVEDPDLEMPRWLLEQFEGSLSLIGKFNGLQWSLASTDLLCVPEQGEETLVANMALRVANLSEIMLGKLAGRLGHIACVPVKQEKWPSEKLERDLWDICLCADLEPNTLQDVLESLSQKERDDAIHVLDEWGSRTASEEERRESEIVRLRNAVAHVDVNEILFYGEQASGPTDPLR